MNVLSLFDGISCGQVALNEAGIEYDLYFASEIDKNAIKVTQSNFPDTIQLGDVKNVKASDLPKIDILLAGSPCQGFSFAGKQLNFDDERSALFFEFVRLLNELKPKYWLLENVDMKQEFQNVISQHVNSRPIKINSALTSAQNRVRLYWSNFEIKQPKNEKIYLLDILESFTDKTRKACIVGRNVDKKGKRIDSDKSVKLTQCLEVRSTNVKKSGCLTTVSKDTVLTDLPVGRHVDAYNKENPLPFRNYTKKERCRLMNLPDDYCREISYYQTVHATGNGWEAGTITHIFNQMILSEKKGLKPKTCEHCLCNNYSYDSRRPDWLFNVLQLFSGKWLCLKCISRSKAQAEQLQLFAK